MDGSAGTGENSQARGQRATSDRARVLLEINNAIVSHLDLAQVLNAISACLRREIQHDFAGLALYDAEANQLRLHALDFPQDQNFLQKGELIPLVGTPAGLAFSSRKPVLRHHVDFNEFTADIMKLAAAHGIKSGCAVPLISHDRIVGSMALASLRESAFTEDDVELLTQIGVQAAIAVENAVNFESARKVQREMTRERDRSKLLLEVNNAVVSHLDLTQLLKSITAKLSGVIAHDSAFISLCTSEGQLQIQALDLGKLENVVFEEGFLIPMEGTPEEKAVTSRQPVLITSVAELMGFASPWVHYAVEHGVKSGCFLPLIAHGRTLGALGVVSLQEAAFTPEDAKLLEQCSRQIAIAVENALNFGSARQAEAEARQERDRSRLLLEINNAVVSHLDLKELLKSISASLHRIVPHDVAFVTLCDTTGTQLRVQALDVHTPREGRPFEEGILISARETPEGEAVRLKRPVLIKHSAELRRFSVATIRQAAEFGIESGCAVPLIAHGHALGAVSMVSFREAAFAEEDAKLLEQCSAQIAIAVQNALNFESAREAERAVRRERDRTKLLLEINNALVAHLDLHELVKVISSSLRQVIHHDSFSLALYDAESGHMFARALDSPSNPVVEGIQYDPKGTASGLAFETGRPVYLPRPDFEQFPSLISKQFFEFGMKSLLSVPVSVHGRKLGVLTFASSREDAWTDDEQELFQEITKQVSIAAANALAVRDLEALKNKLAQEKLYLEDEIRTEFNFDEIVGHSPALREVLKLVETVAASDSTVLLLGETGTGKELIARAVHDHSRRKLRTFVKLNCAAIPTGLLESELFGHEKGAFTGAIGQKIGRLELADQGTLFLDEVGDIPVEIQPKLLRALQEREFERLGSTHTKKVNLRLVAATNRDLDKMIAERQFRSDLYYRLNVFPIRIPPLRERPEDIPLLVRYFAEKFARQMQKSIASIPASSMAKLQAWHWPGNVRELENLIERSVILTNTSGLQVPLPEIDQTASTVAFRPTAETLEATDREQIIKVLRETRGVLAGPNGAASRLGLKRTTLQYKMKKLGITRDNWWPRLPST
jgi:formate hydrogenlyase transcriptional activator